jgi:hypothetical protein
MTQRLRGAEDNYDTATANVRVSKNENGCGPLGDNGAWSAEENDLLLSIIEMSSETCAAGGEWNV